MRNFLFVMLLFWFLMGGTCAFVQNASYPGKSPIILYPAKKTFTKKTDATVPKKSKEYTLGKSLFKNNCATCHNKNMIDDLTGPALKGVSDRWESKTDLKAWIKNSAAFLTSGDAYANGLYKKWEERPMPAFSQFSDEELEAILVYIEDF